MVVPSAVPVIDTFNGGQMTDLPEYAGPYDPTALLELVAPGNEEEGINYSITLALLATYLINNLTDPTIITTGATLGSPYQVLSADNRVLVNKTVPSDTYVTLDAASDRGFTPVMIRDLAGNADVHPISVSFTGTCDGLSSPIVINAPYGGWVFNPLANGNWYLTST